MTPKQKKTVIIVAASVGAALILLYLAKTYHWFGWGLDKDTGDGAIFDPKAEQKLQQDPRKNPNMTLPEKIAGLGNIIKEKKAELQAPWREQYETAAKAGVNWGRVVKAGDKTPEAQVIIMGLNMALQGNYDKAPIFTPSEGLTKKAEAAIYFVTGKQPPYTISVLNSYFYNFKGKPI